MNKWFNYLIFVSFLASSFYAMATQVCAEQYQACAGAGHDIDDCLAQSRQCEQDVLRGVSRDDENHPKPIKPPKKVNPQSSQTLSQSAPNSKTGANKQKDRGEQFEDYEGKPCVYFTRPYKEEEDDMTRFNSYADGSYLCWQGQGYECVNQRWVNRGRCNDESRDAAKREKCSFCPKRQGD